MDGDAEGLVMSQETKCSVWTDSRIEIDRYKWIESERAGYDLGEAAVRAWIAKHWGGFLRARWIDHIHGKTFWIELDRNDFGILPRIFQDKPVLLERIVDRLIAGQENLEIIIWAIDWHIPIDDVVEILTTLDINSRRLCYSFDR
jgi:hypothetical protein